MQNSLSLRQQHFLYQRKNLSVRNLDEVLQARQYQRMIIKSSGWSFYIHPTAPDFIPSSGGAAGEAENHAKRWPVGTHSNIKWKMNDRNMQEGSSWL